MSSYLSVWDTLNKVEGLFRNPNVSLWKRKFWLENERSLSSPSSSLANSFIITHNPDHKRMKRPPSTTVAPSVALVSRPYNPEAFNFTKASLREVVCLVKLRANEPPSFSWLSPLTNAGDNFDLASFPSNDSDVHPVFVNVSPIFRGHGLFVPQVLRGNAQVATTSLLTLGVRLTLLFASETSDFKCGFNSLSAFASVNHFHLHTIFASSLQPNEVKDERSNTLPCEAAPLGKLLWQRTITDKDQGDAILTCNVHDWIIPGFVYSIRRAQDRGDSSSVNHNLTEKQITEISNAAGRLVERLVRSEIPHHFLISEGGSKVYVWPRKPQVPSFNDRSQMALLECAGVLILNEGSAYDESSIDKVTVSELHEELTTNVAQPSDVLDKIVQEEIEAERIYSLS